MSLGYYVFTHLLDAPEDATHDKTIISPLLKATTMPRKLSGMGWKAGAMLLVYQNVVYKRSVRNYPRL